MVLDQGIDTSTAVGRLFFSIVGAIAEFEHAVMSERTIDGLSAARARGRTGGQKPELGPQQAKPAREMYDETDDNGRRHYTADQIAAAPFRHIRFPPQPRPSGHQAWPPNQGCTCASCPADDALPGCRSLPAFVSTTQSLA